MDKKVVILISITIVSFLFLCGCNTQKQKGEVIKAESRIIYHYESSTNIHNFWNGSGYIEIICKYMNGTQFLHYEANLTLGMINIANETYTKYIQEFNFTIKICIYTNKTKEELVGCNKSILNMTSGTNISIFNIFIDENTNISINDKEMKFIIKPEE
jgi:hypothetical protein